MRNSTSCVAILVFMSFSFFLPSVGFTDLPDCPEDVEPGVGRQTVSEGGKDSAGVNVRIDADTNKQRERREEKSVGALTLSPAGAELGIGQSQSFSVTAIYSDGSNSNVTGEAAWSGGQGNTFTASKGGTFTISANYRGASASASITVKKRPVSLSVVPSERTVKIRESVGFTAKAFFDDGSSEDVSGTAAWSPGSSFTAVEAGTFPITASYESVSGSATVTVTKTLVSISLVPTQRNVKINEMANFTAVAVFDDGSTEDVTDLAAWSPGSSFQSTEPGTFTITANYEGRAGAGTVTVRKSDYDPRDDPAVKGDKPVDLAQVDKTSTEFQQGQPGGGTKGPKDQTGFPQPESYTGSNPPGSGTTITDPSTQPPYLPTDSGRDPGRDASDYVKGLPPPKEPTPQRPADKTGTTPGKTPPSTGTTPSGTKSPGIDVQVVGTAPSGKCNIVNGQLVAVDGYPVRIAGMTVTLSGPVNQSTVSSGGGSFSFKEIPAGSYVISVQQWNYGMTKQSFTAPSGKSVKVTLKGSCPFLYAWTGEGFEKENDIYSVARVLPEELMDTEGKALASREGLYLQEVSLENIPDQLKKERSYRDYYQIKKPLKPDHDGYYRFKIREQASEHSFTDTVELLAVDHRPEVRVGVTRKGEIFSYEKLKAVSIFPLTSILSREGRGDLPRQELDSARERIGLYDGETIEVALPKEALRGGVLAVTWQGFQEGDSERGTSSSGRPRLSLRRRDPQGVWQTVDWVYPRDEIDQSFLVLDDLGAEWDTTGKVRLIASSCDREKYHRIDRLEWGKRSTEIPMVTSLPLVSAQRTGEDVRKELTRADGESVLLGPEEELDIRFRSTSTYEGYDRSFVFVSEGFYIPLPLMRLAEGR